ncbi:alkaline phosphatase D family protein [Parvularcula sp. ZS-1/3]|uniref:Alkaline phosphatase D family protein n=1 Tax=Parvularcula mediterranea TaxID=2732508 RepID=A0A7Y3RMD4_9PROT|nr:alkaline phosphatase D family protein [Parvularcula mediterranea]NNU16743.1 alkaline phosphatase D family protein [Parvularcula mediterranea]
MIISRRTALLGGMVGGVGACATKPQLGSFQNAGAGGEDTFACGVASGDPRPDSVVLWTRVHGVSEGQVPVTVVIAEDESFSRMVWRGKAEAGPQTDYCVKVVADRLEPGKSYAYKFLVFDRESPVGFTKTLPLEAESARFAIASCTNYQYGFFNAYDHIARQEGLDAVLHLGDYLYEYGPDGYGGDVGAAIGRLHEPAKEIVVLDDYRQRHRQYKADPASQRMHAKHPLIAIWDDHETSNDSWKDGAENHQPETEGPWAERKRAAMQAYYEYMPVREPVPGRTREEIWRDYGWGKYLTVTAIESRLTARTKPIGYEQAAPMLAEDGGADRYRAEVLNDPERRLLGAEQMDYVMGSLKRSVDTGAEWRLIANQILFARVSLPALSEYVGEAEIAAIEPLFPEIRDFMAYTSAGLPYNTDSWDGYPVERERFYEASATAGASDLVVLTGDTHQFWANDLKRDDGTHMGVELGTAGITSPGPAGLFGDKAFDFSLLMRRDNPEVRYTDAINNGYLLLSFEEDRGRVDFITMSTVRSPNYTATRGASFDLVKKNGTVEFAKPKGLGFKERVLYR